MSFVLSQARAITEQVQSIPGHEKLEREILFDLGRVTNN